MTEKKPVIQEKIKELSEQKKLKEKNIFIFGHNLYTGFINNCLYEEGYKLCGVLDNDDEKQGKKICNIRIIAPENIDWGGVKEKVILIASKHAESMVKQIRQFSKQTEIYELFDCTEIKRKEMFWKEENYATEMKELDKGHAVYEKIKQKEALVIFPPTALGDIFVGCLTLHEYTKKMKTIDRKIVVSSKGAYEVTQLFKINNVSVISKQEMETLIKFLCFCGIDNDNIVCSWGTIFWSMSLYQKIPFAEYNAKYYFKLKNFQMDFPSIWSKNFKEYELIDNGLIKGKTVVLAPYANSIEELPMQFWEALVEKLSKRGYCVVTNIIGEQKPIKRSIGLEIPLEQVGNYLEFAGFFVALRSGLCDVAGHSKCKQIIIYRDTSLFDFYDLRIENISEYAIQCVYDDDDFKKNINIVIELLLDKY